MNQNTVLIEEDAFGMSCRQLVRELDTRGVESLPVYEPMHRSLAHVGAEVVGGEVADRLHQTGLSLPSSVGLTAEQQSRVISIIQDASILPHSPA